MRFFVSFLWLSPLILFLACASAGPGGRGSRSIDLTIRNIDARREVQVLACYQEPDITWILGEIKEIAGCIDDNATENLRLASGAIRANLVVRFRARPRLICGVFSSKSPDGKTGLPASRCVDFVAGGRAARALTLDAVAHTIQAEY